jgi:hypothetical protein
MIRVSFFLCVLRGLRVGSWPAAALACLLWPASTHAQPPAASGAAAGPRRAEAVRVEAAPALDGDVLTDPAWTTAEPLADFWQTTPVEGQPASERTEVRIVYTRDTLYFGVVCFDSDPAGIIASDSRRDAGLSETDSIQIILDTYRDRQNGFVFGTNPAGLEYDGQVVNEGQGGGGGGRQQAGSGGGFNLNWDGAWQVRTRTSEIGWTAEIAIPFRTLRYPSARRQVWGLNIQRNIRRRNETAFWSALPRQYNLYKLSLAGEIGGLEVPPQRNLKLVPYVLGETRKVDARDEITSLGDVGFDAKYSITPSLTLDATVNTDFAQVEVDEERVNLDRFNLFFPEKRPFFLENAGLFSVGSPRETEIFFSRRIGIAPSGQPIPIVAGARLTGNVRGFSVGLLDMQTDDTPGVAPGNNFLVARLRRDLPNRSSAGAIFVNRDATGDGAGPGDHNRTLAVDGRLGIGQNGLVAGYLARTATPGLDGDDHALELSSLYSSQRWRLGLAYSEVARNFNPEVGFLVRKNFRQVEGQVFHTIRLRPDRWLHEIRPHVNFASFWNFSGFQETGYLHIDNDWAWQNGAEVDTGINVTREGVTQPFEIFPGVIVPAGTYDHVEAQILTMTNQGAPVSFAMTTHAGGLFGGRRVAMTPRLRLRVGDTFNTELGLTRNDIDLPGGSFVTNTWRSRTSYSFTPRLFVQALVQYNDRADLWSSNLRLGWLQDANTGLFVVYNDTRELGRYDLVQPNTGRSVIVKFSRLFDVLR